MKQSIRKRITLLFVGLMAAMLFAIWAVNNFWLEKYYTNRKLAVMEEAYSEIDAAVMERVNAGENIGDVIARENRLEWDIWRQMTENENSTAKNGSKSGPERGKADGGKQDPPLIDESLEEELQNSLLWLIRGYAEENNINIILIDSSSGRAMLGFGPDSEFLAKKVQRYVLGMGGDERKVLSKHENYTVQLAKDPRGEISYLESWGYFSDNNTVFMMQMPLASIHESVMLSNRFTLFVGLVALIVGSLVMYVAAHQVAKPIMSLAKLSERMSDLDFTARYEGNAQDEIGVLGTSMNTLSKRLEQTITQLKQANAQLKHDIQEKIEIDEMRKEFIANVSHELKTPIALIQGYAEGLTEGMAEDPESRDYYCGVIADEADKMNKMVKQLLTLTALEFGNDTPVLENFDLHDLIRDLLSSASILLEQKGAQVEFTPAAPLMVCADEFKIEEVLTNYLNNALNHLSGDRIVRIQTGRAQGVVWVSVFNTGDPIPEQDIPNLWTKFYKVDKARTRSYGGSGIGLSIVKAIMDAHHQRCGVANVADGVTFWFTLEPARQEENNT